MAPTSPRHSPARPRANYEGSAPVFAPGSVEEAHLRNHSSYMAPDAAGKARLLLRIVGGALWHLLLMAVLVLIVFWLASWAYAEFSGQLAGDADGFVLNRLGLWTLLASSPLILGLFLTGELWKADSRRPWADRVAWLMVLTSYSASGIGSTSRNGRCTRSTAAAWRPPSTRSAKDSGEAGGRRPHLDRPRQAGRAGLPAIVTKPGETPPGGAAVPFVFSASTVGVRLRSAADGSGGKRTVPEVAMSGAAVSPLMGKETIHAVRFLMALMNVLRRGCATVFCLDGGGDPPGVFRALGEAVALSRSELQVDADLSTERDPDAGYAGSFMVFGHDGCVGDEGHCDVTDRYEDELDFRAPHALTPWTKVVQVTEAVGRVKDEGELHLTVVPVVPGDDAAQQTDALKFESVRLALYAD